MSNTKNTLSKVALPKLFLWNDPTRYQEYPEALSRAEAGRVYSRKEIEQELFDITPTLTYKKDGKPRGRGTDGIVNAMGYERFGQRLCVNGLDFIRKTEGGFIATESGLELGRIYRESEDNSSWLNFLARHLLLREPRTRLVFGLMLKGWRLQTAVTNSFPKGQMSLISPENKQLDITSKDCQYFNELLVEHGELALGPLWIDELNEEGFSAPFLWCGIRVDQPSVKDLSSAIKKSFGLFFYLSLFEENSNGWSVGHNMLSSKLGYDVLSSFGEEDSFHAKQQSREEKFFKALEETIDEQGFTIVSALAEKFGNYCEAPHEEWDSALDQFFREAMYKDRLTIVAYHSGQPRMGRGLFGDNNFRRLKVEFIPFEKVTASNYSKKITNLRRKSI